MGKLTLEPDSLEIFTDARDTNMSIVVQSIGEVVRYNIDGIIQLFGRRNIEYIKNNGAIDCSEYGYTEDDIDHLNYLISYTKSIEEKLVNPGFKLDQKIKIYKTLLANNVPKEILDQIFSILKNNTNTREADSIFVLFEHYVKDYNWVGKPKHTSL